jgi:hypothetical protein
VISDQTEQVRGRLSVAGPLLNGEGSPDEDVASYKSSLTHSLALWAEGRRWCTEEADSFVVGACCMLLFDTLLADGCLIFTLHSDFFHCLCE